MMTNDVQTGVPDREPEFYAPGVGQVGLSDAMGLDDDAKALNPGIAQAEAFMKAQDEAMAQRLAQFGLPGIQPQAEEAYATVSADGMVSQPDLGTKAGGFYVPIPAGGRIPVSWQAGPDPVEGLREKGWVQDSPSPFAVEGGIDDLHREMPGKAPGAHAPVRQSEPEYYVPGVGQIGFSEAARLDDDAKALNPGIAQAEAFLKAQDEAMARRHGTASISERIRSGESGLVPDLPGGASGLGNDGLEKF